MKTIRQFYPLNLKEGEGVGTSYEYYAKNFLISKIFPRRFKNKKILVFGLPGKYGLSVDFCLLAKNNFLTVVDKNVKKINRLKKIISSQDIRKIKYLKQDPLDYVQENKMVFDVLLSSEHLQNRAREENQIFKKYFFKTAKSGIIFVPNKNNQAHQKISKIKGLSLEEVSELIPESKQRNKITGFVDIPPFLPGIKISDSSGKDKIRLFYWLLFLFGPLLELWAKLERFLPKIVKKNHAHMVYAAFFPKK